jgi:hypothetical protein
MLRFFIRPTGHPETDTILREAGLRWETLAEQGSKLSPGEMEALYPPVSPDVDIPQEWASSFYLLPYADQVLLAFAWLHWWQHSQEEASGFAGWLHKGPGFALNHVSLMKVLTQNQSGALGIVHRFLETILEQAGDWDGDRETGQTIVRLLEDLDVEYRYNVHDRELWPAVLQLLQTDR